MDQDCPMLVEIQQFKETKTYAVVTPEVRDKVVIITFFFIEDLRMAILRPIHRSISK